jgi:hypothetical protein
MLLLGLGAWAGISVLGMYRGCSSAALPPTPEASDLAKVRAAHFPVTIGVERYRWPVYSERLIGALRSTGLFDAVGSLEELPDATLVARVERPIHGTATIPVFTVLSLGFIPTTVQEEWGESFSLQRNGVASQPVGVEFSYRGPSTLGWWATVRSMSPDISTADPRETERFRDALSVAICARQSDILRLVEGP